jgi:hypothetical protein
MPCRHPALALDLNLPLGFEGELIFQASVHSVADLDAAGYAVALHAARGIHGVAPKIIAEPQHRWRNAESGGADLAPDPPCSQNIPAQAVEANGLCAIGSDKGVFKLQVVARGNYPRYFALVKRSAIAIGLSFLAATAHAATIEQRGAEIVKSSLSRCSRLDPLSPAGRSKRRKLGFRLFSHGCNARLERGRRDHRLR